jgi:PncC family amidohydrolase
VCLEERLGDLLRQRGDTISVAESCTGGLLASRITDVPGSSAYFRGGIVAYQNDVKERLLGVSKEILKRFGAVSEESARAMAHGCRKLFSSDIAVAITGIAGPSGGSAEKPVGLVYIAVSTLNQIGCERFCWPGDRALNKESSVRAALKMVVRTIKDAEAGWQPEGM